MIDVDRTTVPIDEQHDREPDEPATPVEVNPIAGKPQLEPFAGTGATSLPVGLPPSPLPIVIGGCSFQASCGGKTIDSKKGEKIIAERIKADTGIDVKATCPTGVKIKKGGTFDCTFELGGVKGKVLVTQNDDAGNVSFEVTEGFVLGAKVEAAIAANLKENGIAASAVSCGACWSGA